MTPTNPSDSRSAHHTAHGFRNSRGDDVAKGLGDLLRWRWNAWRHGLPKAARTPTPRVAPDLAEIHANAARGTAMTPLVTWVGHATMLVQAGGLNILTDPVFGPRASPLSFAGPKRAQPPGLSIDELPAIDLVLVSHNHYDHLDRGSVVALAARAPEHTLFVVPLGLKAWMAREGITNVVELDWWQRHRIAPAHGGAPVDVHLTPVQHWSSRTPWDRNRTLWGGYAVLGEDLHWYFSGDTGYSDDFVATRRHFEALHADGFDLALLAVGAYEPRWFMKDMHVNPEEAVRIHLDLHAKASIGLHWGTFQLTDEPLDQPVADLAAARDAHGVPASAFTLMKIGESRVFAPRTAAAERPDGATIST